ncbi:MAG: tRNA epoxyqueuosine(34) reductase QueG [Gemmatimonadales bacterium]
MTLLAERVKARAAELGFVACGVTDLAPNAQADRFDRWLAAGHAGVMRYLHRQAAKRRDPAHIVPRARRAVIVLENYYHAETDDSRRAPRVAKYARGSDYHTVTYKRLQALAGFLRTEGATVAHPWVDDGPVPERELARRAGLGWIGKNAMLIRPGVGSFCFIGTVFTDLLLAVDAPFEAEHCGSCTRCLDACPTGAFVEPGVVDATRCISYLTIEQDGPIPDELAPKLSGWAFGCDICNDVCPWNERFARESSIAEFADRRPLAGVTAATLDRMSDRDFEERFGGTPLARAGREGLLRNVAAVEQGG